MRRECVAGEGEGALDDDLLAERGLDDVEGPPERGEDVLVDLLADRPEPLLLADQRDAASEDDPVRGDEGDRLGQGV